MNASLTLAYINSRLIYHGAQSHTKAAAANAELQSANETLTRTVGPLRLERDQAVSKLEALTKKMHGRAFTALICTL